MFDLLVAYRVSDMLFAVKIEEAGKSSSTKFQSVSSMDELTRIMKNGKTLIVCDLTQIKSELELITSLAMERHWKILGYYPHIDKETEKLARSLGVDYTTPRSAFQHKLAAVLA